MLFKTAEIKGFTLKAKDDEIGRVRDLYFEDQSWVIRYLIVDTGKWLPGRKVLLSPYAVQGICHNDRLVEIALSREQIENSPSIDEDQPVSRQFERRYFRYYNWPYYWQGAGMWGPLPRPEVNYGQVTAPPEAEPRQEMQADPHLRSAAEVKGYRIQARDGEIGHIEDFVVDDENWAVRYLVVDTRNWWPGKRVLVSPDWAHSISWEKSEVRLALEKEKIRQAPEYDESAPITREYELRLFDHYLKGPHWEHRKAA